MKAQSRSGFTIVEMAIVVTVIGLIIGGILVGGELLRQAELRSMLSDWEKIQSGISSFKTKYDALPGDFSAAERIWGSDSTCPITASSLVPKTATCNGNGNGIIDPVGWAQCSDAPSGYQQEMFRLWQHLSNSELYQGRYSGVNGSLSVRQALVGTNIPESSKIKGVGYHILNFGGRSVSMAAMPETLYWYSMQYETILVTGRKEPTDCFEPRNPFLTPGEARSIDSKMDDGKPFLGKLMTFLSSLNPGCVNANSSAADYATGKTETCSLIYHVKWW